MIPGTASGGLLLAEGHTVGALVYLRIVFVGTHQNPVQRTVVLVFAVVSALLNGTFNALVGMAVHSCFLLKIGFGNSMAFRPQKNRGKDFLLFAFCLIA